MGEEDNWGDPLDRADVVKRCPGPTAPPNTVREWFQSYLAYRGLNPHAANECFWTGLELHQTSPSELQEAFKKYCRLHDWEANILAADVRNILEISSPLATPKRTYFQRASAMLPHTRRLGLP
ncbi:hypothetical protein F4819DRAFT_492899 [Hypoxylon fuscum]|nr:hypothetical protein F4819DRAFT_492899 [Hypoxylon fuscum]